MPHVPTYRGRIRYPGMLKNAAPLDEASQAKIQALLETRGRLTVARLLNTTPITLGKAELGGALVPEVRERILAALAKVAA